MILILFIKVNVIGQNGSAQHCINAEPLCGSQEFYYPNTSGVNFAENGPDYSCLNLQLNPAWFYLQIEESGNIELRIEQSTIINEPPNLDVDFIVYGPFNDPTSACTDNLISSNIVDCSYSPNFVEIVNLTNVRAGEYYLLLITNFSILSGFITVEQTYGSATTNCTFLTDPIVSNINGCEGQSLTMNANTTNATHYKWYEDDGSGTNNFVVINDVNSATLDVTTANKYKTEAFDSNNILLDKYQFNVVFFQTPDIPESIQSYEICDNLGDNDGIGQFDLSNKDLEILNDLNPSDFIVTYYDNLTDANTGNNHLPLLYINNFQTELSYVRVENTLSNELKCFDVNAFEIQVNVFPKFDLEEAYILCVNTNGTEEITAPPVIDTGLDSMNYRFYWRLNGVVMPNEQESSITPIQGGEYSVEAINVITGCSNTATTVANLSSPPIVSASVTSFAFSNNHTVEATATGSGYQIFEFRLDDGEWQNNGIFNNVSFGEHTIIARDIIGCGVSSVTVTVIDFPLYFTPNGDGYHDTWNIEGLTNQQQARIYVFDRYGKLLKQLSPASSGWDGTFNGSVMPTNDYWFLVEYIDPRDSRIKHFKSHFALKR